MIPVAAEAKAGSRNIPLCARPHADYFNKGKVQPNGFDAPLSSSISSEGAQINQLPRLRARPHADYFNKGKVQPNGFDAPFSWSISSEGCVSRDPSQHHLEPGRELFSEYHKTPTEKPERKPSSPPLEADDEEEEQEPVVDEAKQWRNSLMALAVTTMIWIIVIVIFLIGYMDFEAPSCPVVRIAKPCQECGTGTFFIPIFGDYETSLPTPLRSVLYFIGLIWVFLGIGIICDQFMGAVEEITSKDRVVWVESSIGVKQKFHIKIWNPTVANLTLMALGSSAPEILLNVLEVFGNGYCSGELGASTIVGSAAFNLLVITSVCVSALPDGDVRKVDNTHVFAVTAFWSIFAYVWLVIILAVVTPDVVDLWEALLTLVFFPVLTSIAYCADRGYIANLLNCRLGSHEAGRISESEALRLRSQYGNVLPLELIAAKKKQDAGAKDTWTKAKIRKMLSVKGLFKKLGDAGEVLELGFARKRYACFEDAGNIELKIITNRPPGVHLTVRWQTVEGTAKEGERFKHASGELYISPMATEGTIAIEVVDNNIYEEAMDFYVTIVDATVSAAKSMRTTHVDSGFNKLVQPTLRIRTAIVTVYNDDVPGTLGFLAHEVLVAKGATQIQLGVMRTHGHCGEISCRYRTVDKGATSGRDFTAVETFVTFADGETFKTIEFEIAEGRSAKFDESFKVVIDDASPGVKFDKHTDGGIDCAICEVIIPATDQQTAWDRVVHYVYDHDRFMKNCEEWKDQFASALYCNGDACEQSEAGPVDWIFHGLTLYFKIAFAFVPTPGFLGGWPTFVLALGTIGLVTAIVGDLALLLGCTLGIPDDVTAITLVALGTSLPDTFASKVAAQQNANADDSVGNVTGSNCVNVFLGLGLPWTIGAAYWYSQGGRSPEWDNHLWHGRRYKDVFGAAHPDGGFVVPAGNLVFSVGVFTSCAVVCICILVTRRIMHGGELGGPMKICRRDSAMLGSLWVIYIAASIIQSVTSDSERDH